MGKGPSHRLSRLQNRDHFLSSGYGGISCTLGLSNHTRCPLRSVPHIFTPNPSLPSGTSTTARCSVHPDEVIPTAGICTDGVLKSHFPFLSQDTETPTPASPSPRETTRTRYRLPDLQLRAYAVTQPCTPFITIEEVSPSPTVPSIPKVPSCARFFCQVMNPSSDVHEEPAMTFPSPPLERTDAHAFLA